MSTPRRALITGITGQDGSYLAELLVSKGYTVHGTVRRVALEDPDHRLSRLSTLRDNIVLHACSCETYASTFDVVAAVQPDECYHLAAQSFVAYSFDDEFSTFNTNINGTHFILSALKALARNCRFYFAGSSEMFCLVDEVPQNERTRFHPLELRHQQGGRLRAHPQLPRSLRHARLQRHPVQPRTPRRGFEFVSRKITAAVARILAGRSNQLRLGNLDAKRDWGSAREYVEAMWLMLQQPEPDDYVVATGESHTVRDFVELAFDYAGLDWKKHVIIDPALFRPAEINILLGDAAKARTKLGWKPRTSFEALVREMVDADCEALGVSRAAQRTL